MRLRPVLVPAAALIAAAVALAGCGGSPPRPDVPACKAALQRVYDSPDWTSLMTHLPPECHGVPYKTVEQLLTQIVTPTFSS